jgi:hypothetical protein
VRCDERILQLDSLEAGEAAACEEERKESKFEREKE